VYSTTNFVRVKYHMVEIVVFPPTLPSWLYLVWPERPHVTGDIGCTNKKGEYRFPHTPLNPYTSCEAIGLFDVIEIPPDDLR